MAKKVLISGAYKCLNFNKKPSAALLVYVTGLRVKTNLVNWNRFKCPKGQGLKYLNFK